MTLKEQIYQDLKDAMRARDKETVNALRQITAAIKQIEVDERIAVDDTRLLALLEKQAKQRKESILQFQVAERDNLVNKEQQELTIIEQYLPEPLGDDDLQQLIIQAISEMNAQTIRDMGKVMNYIKPKVQGKADMSHVSAIIKEKLTH